MLFSVHVFENNPSLRLIFVRSERLGMFRRATAFHCGENVSRGISESCPDKGKKRKGKRRKAGREEMIRLEKEEAAFRSGAETDADVRTQKSPEAFPPQGSW